MANKKLLSQLPLSVRELVGNLHTEGVHSILVGGSVRDFFLKGKKNPVDLDIEIRHEHTLEKIKALVKKSQPLAIKSLPFEIIRITLEGVTLELAPPRREVYPSGQWFKHDQFEVNIAPSLTPSHAWLRRDFTVNAIGIDLTSTELVDPFNGMADLKNKILRPCGPDFFLDPVRFLRLLRFQSQFNFSLHPDMERELSRFNLKGLSFHYFFKESFLTPFFPFAKNFFDTTRKYSIEVPEEMKGLEFLTSLALPSPDNLNDLLMTIIYSPSPPSSNQLKQFVKYAKIATVDMRRHIDFRQNLEKLGTIDKKIPDGTWEKAPVTGFLEFA